MSRSVFPALILCLLALASAPFHPASPVGAAQVPQAVPPELDFGSVYVGAVVEGSFRVTDANMVRISSAPSWIEVVYSDPERRNPSGSGSVGVRVDTSTPGELRGAIVVETDAGDLTVPVSARVLDSPPRLDVLVYSSPFFDGSTTNPQFFSTLRSLMEDAEANVSYVLPQDWHRVSGSLESFDVIILDGSGLLSLSQARIKSYVRSGGYLVVFASHFFIGTVDAANQLTGEFGLTFRDEEGSGWVSADRLAEHWLTEGVSNVRLLRPTPIEASPPNSLVIAGIPGESGDVGMVAFSEVDGGGILAVGSPLWWAFFLQGDPDGNDRLLLNLFDRAASGERPEGATEETGPNVTLSPQALEISPGDSADPNLTLESLGGFEAEVLLGWTVTPATAHMAVEPPSGPVHVSSGEVETEPVTVRVDEGIEPGNYTVSLTCVAGGERFTVNATVSVPPPPPTETAAPAETEAPPTETETQPPATSPPQTEGPSTTTPPPARSGGRLSSPVAAAIGAVVGGAVVALAAWMLASRRVSRGGGRCPHEGQAHRHSRLQRRGRRPLLSDHLH